MVRAIIRGARRRSGAGRRALAWAAALSWTVFSHGAGFASDSLCSNPDGQPRDCAILMVHSYHPGLEWNRTLTEGFREAFASTARIRIDAEYLDAKRRPDLRHADAFVSVLIDKYRSDLPDVLVIADDPVFTLLWPRRGELFPGVPIVFMGLNGIRDDLQGAHGVTGIFEHHRTEETIALSLALTGAKGIVVINDTSETGLANESTLSKVMKQRPDVQWVIQRDVSTDNIRDLERYPSDWPIVPCFPCANGGRTGRCCPRRVRFACCVSICRIRCSTIPSG